MNKLWLFLCLFRVVNGLSYNYHVKMEFKGGNITDRTRSSIILDGKAMQCDCGRKPVYLIFYYGYPKAFCYKHLPIKEDAPQVDFESLITTQQGDENGAKS